MDSRALKRREGRDGRTTDGTSRFPVFDLATMVPRPWILEAAENFKDVDQHDGFGRRKKSLLLEMYAVSPNLTGIAETLGHSRQVVSWHLERDEAFKKAFDAVREGLCDTLEDKVFEFAQRPQNFMDRIAYLRAYRPGTWNPDRQLTVTHNVDVVTRLAAKVATYKTGAIEAKVEPETRQETENNEKE